MSEKHLAFGGRIGYNTIRSASAEFAGVAQLVERVIGNDEVHGSDSHHQLQTKNHPTGGFLFGIAKEGGRSRDPAYAGGNRNGVAI